MERPVLFNGAMVRKVLSGEKMQTRRPVKNAHGAFWDHGSYVPFVDSTGTVQWLIRGDGAVIGSPHPSCPLGAPGDRLWVRETWRKYDRGSECECYDLTCPCPPTGTPLYRADNEELEGVRWTPSIHMPRSVSRITLAVTAVRVERLRLITANDVCAEGFDPREPGDFFGTWDAIYGRNARLRSASNPMVWVVTFRKVD